MSLLREHIMIPRGYLAPSFVRSNTANYNSVTAFTITTPTQPAQGNLIVLSFGGSQSRTYTLPAGFTDLNMSLTAGTLGMAYKIAGAGEASSFTVTMSAGLQGTIEFLEFSNVDNTTPFISDVFNSAVTATSSTVGSLTASIPSVYISGLQLGGGSTWTIDNSFTDITGPSVRHRTAYKIYTSTKTETTTWSGAPQLINTGMAWFQGKKIKI